MEATINLIPKQTEAWNYFETPEITELGYGGAAGGGKTRLGCYLAIVIAEQYPTSRGAIGRKELKNLRLTTLAELFLIFGEMGYKEGVDFKYNAQDSVIRFKNKSEILLLDTAYSPQDPEYTRFGSLNLTWAWIEESNETPEKGKTILKTRVGRNNTFTIGGKRVEFKSFFLETFNPNKGHVHRDYYKPWKENRMPSYRRFVRALPGDNPHLPAIYMENLRRSDEITKQRLLYGNFDYDADPARLIEYDAILDLRSNTIDDKNKDRFIVNDIARFGGDKIVISEWEGLTLTGLTIRTYQGLDITRDTIKERARECKVPFSHIISDEDGVGGGVVDSLKGTKGFVGNSSPLEMWDPFLGRMVRENFTNLRSQCYFKLAELVNNHQMAIKLRYFNTNIEGYTKEKAMAELEEELDHIKKTDTPSQNTKMGVIVKDDIKEEIGRSPDLADILMMRMLFVLKADKAKGEYLPPIRIGINKKKVNPAR